VTEHAPTGRFIVFEGIDGSGKTTQLQRLAEWLPNSGLMPSGALLHVTREPGGTALGQSLRQLLLHPPDGTAPCPIAELLLYAADRAQHVETVIRPALAAGDWVLCDRFTGSTVAYQGYGRGLSPRVITKLERIATGGLRPDLTIWLKLPVAESLRRRGDRPADRIEASGEAFLQRVGDGFAHLALQRDWQRVNAMQSVDEVAKDCSRLVGDFLRVTLAPRVAALQALKLPELLERFSRGEVIAATDPALLELHATATAHRGQLAAAAGVSPGAKATGTLRAVLAAVGWRLERAGRIKARGGNRDAYAYTARRKA